MKKEKHTPVDLLDFEWDIDEATDFFEEETPKEEVVVDKEEVVDKKEDDKEEKEEEIVEDKKEVEEEVTFSFEEPETDDENDTNENQINYKSIAEGFKEKGIISTDIDVTEIEDEDDFLALQEKEIGFRVEKELESFTNDLGEEGKLLIKYIKEGGTSEDFFKVLQETSSIPLYEEENDGKNSKVVDYYLRNIKEITDDEDITETIENLKEKGTLDKYAEKYSIHLKKVKDKREQAEMSKIETQKKNAEKSKKEFEKNISEFIDNTDTLNNIELVDSEKKELKEYIFKPKKSKGSKKYISQFSDDLQNVFKDPSKMITLAKIMKSDFKLDDIMKEMETKVTKKTKTKINTYKKPKNNNNKSLADFFND